MTEKYEEYEKLDDKTRALVNDNLKEPLENLLKMKSYTNNTKKNYVIGINKLYELVKGEEFKNLNFLKKFNKVMKAINTLNSIQTRKQRVSVAVVFLQANNFKSDLINQYRAELKKLNDNIMNKYNDNIKTQTENKNWLSWDEVLKLREKLHVLAEIHLKQDPLTQDDIFEIQKYIVLCLYTMYPPLRNTFVNMKIITNKKEDDNFNNFLYVTKKQMKFIFNDYKTVKTYGKRVEIVPEELRKILRRWITINRIPYMLTTQNGLPMVNGTSFTNFMHRIFLTHTGKKIGTSLLRKIYISEHNDEYKSVNERKKLAEKMQHSLQMADGVYKKIPTTKRPKLKEIFLED